MALVLTTCIHNIITFHLRNHLPISNSFSNAFRLLPPLKKIDLRALQRPTSYAPRPQGGLRLLLRLAARRVAAPPRPSRPPAAPSPAPRSSWRCCGPPGPVGHRPQGRSHPRRGPPRALPRHLKFMPKSSRTCDVEVKPLSRPV